jgi:murein DD-endopeptidase MepM/ murein hydrolase activator NlpD
MNIRKTLLILTAFLLLSVVAGVKMTASVLERGGIALEKDNASESILSQKKHSLKLLDELRLASGHERLVGARLHEVERERRMLQRQIDQLTQSEVLHGAAPEQETDASALVSDLSSRRFSDALGMHQARRFLQRMAQRAGLQFTGGSSVYTAEKLLALRERDSALQKKQDLLADDLERNEKRVRANTNQLAAARQMMRQTQDIMFEMQAHLERIDAQITRRQERQRIARGEMDPQLNKYEEEQGYEDEFIWPAKARITAGFLESSYLKFFGIPHKGIDIAVPQGTRIKVAADGIVYLARDAGMGYSYVLVIHRNGYATLYGHLSRIDVKSGDSLDAGQIIGLSGATPGTPGAGLVTTGAHLHFEVTKDGKHIDPHTLLP